MSPNEARNLLDNYLYMLEATVDHYDKKFRADAKNPNLKNGERRLARTSYKGGSDILEPAKF
jgi:hypothetical protein